MKKYIESYIAIYNLLHDDFSSYVNINKVAKKLKLNNRTVKSAVEHLFNKGLFNKPICEWHDEEVRCLNDET